jgi:hypothetical protein
MSSDHPNHHDAALMIQVYELRREPRLREARATINAEFWPASLDDVMAIVKLDHPLNVFWRQAGTYWEMVYGMARHGIVHPEYWMESNAEGLLLYAKICPWLADLRRETNPASFRHAEWVATETHEGRRIFSLFRARVEKTLASRR